MTLSLVPTSEMTEREFGTVFAKLAMQLRWTDADILTVKSYYEVLADLPLDAVQSSAEAFAREAGRKFFPTSAEWFQAAQVIRADSWRKIVSLNPAREEPWAHECLACEDTGWVLPMDCAGDSVCGRTKQHSPHTFTRVCGCRATNRTYQRHHQNGPVGATL